MRQKGVRTSGVSVAILMAGVGCPAGEARVPDAAEAEVAWALPASLRDAVGRIDTLRNRPIWIEGGTFAMGVDDGYPSLGPAHDVTVSSFWIQEHEVTNAEFRRFDPTHPSVSGPDDHPVVYVQWREAMAYAESLGGSLPTEAQWEYAARGRGGRTYPWGEAPPTCALAHYEECAPKGTIPVLSLPGDATPEGVRDLAGNVMEWVFDRYGRYGSRPETNPTGPESGDHRVLRGGSWMLDTAYLPAPVRTSWPENSPETVAEMPFIGFRVAWPGDAGPDSLPSSVPPPSPHPDVPSDSTGTALDPIEFRLTALEDSSDYLVYRYEATNPASSGQGMAEIRLDASASAGAPSASLPATGYFLDGPSVTGSSVPVAPHATVGPISPPDWASSLDRRSATLSWFGTNGRMSDRDSIAPGETLTGLGIRSTFLPAIRRVGGTPTWQSCCQQPGRLGIHTEPSDFMDTSLAVAPGHQPEEVTIRLLQEQLRTICSDAPWIDDGALCMRFVDLLDRALAGSTSGDVTRAVSALADLRNGVDAERARMEPEAYWLLRYNIRQVLANIR